MTNNKIAVLGNGFLGKEFSKKGYEVLDRSEFEWPIDTIRLGIFKQLEPYDTIINCIGCADTRYCEDPENWSSVYNINAKLVSALSKYCKHRNKKFVHISTGCVYDKNNQPQKETDFTSSHCRYVVSKLTAEYYCSPNDLILRPRLYFSDTPDKNNLLTKLPKFERHLTEINSYTSTKTIVEATQALLEAGQSGIFNVAQEGYATIEQICQYIGIIKKPTLNGEELRQEQGLYLVNNILDISKLKKFYQPRNLEEELSRCWNSIKNHPSTKTTEFADCKNFSVNPQNLADRWG